MGGEASINYAVPVTPKVEGESAIYRMPEYKDALRSTKDPNITTLKDAILNTYTKSPNSPALGTTPPTQEGSSKMKRELTPSSTSPTRKPSSEPNRWEAPSSARGSSTCRRESA